MDKDTALILVAMVGVGYIVLKGQRRAVPMAAPPPTTLGPTTPLQQAQDWLSQLVGGITKASGGSNQQANQAAGITGSVAGLAGALAQLFGSQSSQKGIPEWGASGSDSVNGTGGYTGQAPSLGGGLTLNDPTTGVGLGGYSSSTDSGEGGYVPTGQAPSLGAGGGLTLNDPTSGLGDDWGSWPT